MMLGKRFEDVTEAERATAKVTELATLYGETHWNLSKRLYGNSKKESLAEAKRLQDAYYAAHPHIKSWQKA
jgi:DNA polymerase I-like protein with 3'-5' exonuclease and polymerase domains